MYSAVEVEVFLESCTERRLAFTDEIFFNGLDMYLKFNGTFRRRPAPDWHLSTGFKRPTERFRTEQRKNERHGQVFRVEGLERKV